MSSNLCEMWSCSPDLLKVQGPGLYWERSLVKERNTKDGIVYTYSKPYLVTITQEQIEDMKWNTLCKIWWMVPVKMPTPPTSKRLFGEEKEFKEMK